MAALVVLFHGWPLVAADGLLDRPEELAAKVDELFSPWNRPDVPGCAVGIVRDGKLIYSKGFGTANLEDQAPNTPQTIFEIASASKSFTCACLSLLMDQGKVHPDDELSRFVPQMHKFEPPVRVGQMVQCRTGLWEPFHLMPLLGLQNLPIQSPYGEADVLTALTGQKRLPFEPGSQFRYGSGDYFLLGQIIKRVSGKSLDEFARENLFRPLGMTRTFYDEYPARVVPGRAVGHLRENGVWHQWRGNGYWVGGGGVNTCVEDLARWDANFYDSRLPKGKYMDEFIREGTLLGNRHVLDADAYLKYVQPPKAQNSPAGQYRGLKRIQFTGGSFGMSAAVSRFPERRFTAICLSNSDELSPFTKTRELADLVLADRLQPMPKSATDDESKEPVQLPRAELENKVGAYRLVDEGRIWKVEIVDGDLQVVDPIKKAHKLIPLSATRFLPSPDGRFYKSARFSFHRANVDEPYSMILESNEGGFHEVIEFRPVELVDPKSNLLNEYAGEYFSDELSANYRFMIKDGALWLRVGSRPWEQLDPTVADEFIPHVRTLPDNRIISFQRENGRVIGFTIAFWRVKDVRFDKR
jgi:CubicO group peptidase (beta-lactamase class C family)